MFIIILKLPLLYHLSMMKEKIIKIMQKRKNMYQKNGKSYTVNIQMMKIIILKKLQTALKTAI